MYTYIVHWSANGLRQRERVQAFNSYDATQQVMARYHVSWEDVYTAVLAVD